MACTSITALPKTCSPDLVQGGVSRVLMISAADLISPAVTYATSGIISNIAVADGKQYVEVGVVKNTVNLVEELTKSIESGTGFYTQTLTVVLTNLNQENIDFIDNIQNQPVSVVFQSKSGAWFGIGFESNIEVTGLSAATGTAEGDMSGYTITFSGTASKVARIVDSTLIDTITQPAD